MPGIALDDIALLCSGDLSPLNHAISPLRGDGNPGVAIFRAGLLWRFAAARRDQ